MLFPNTWIGLFLWFILFVINIINFKFYLCIISKKFLMDEFNLVLVHVSIDIGVLEKHLMFESSDSTSCDNEDEPSLHRFGVIVYCGARYAWYLPVLVLFMTIIKARMSQLSSLYSIINLKN